jgi:Family of unknown function (DUF6510)
MAGSWHAPQGSPHCYGLGTYRVHRLAPRAAGEADEPEAIFPFEMTLAQVTCTGCGATNAIGATAAYMHGMGTVIRCPSCDTALIRVAQVRGHSLLDMRGVRVLQMKEG